LHAHQAEVFDCVAKQAGVVDGEALLRVIVGGNARGARVARQVEVLKVEPAEGHAHAVAACVAGAARAWDLSALGAGEGDQVVFPLAFQPERPGAGHVAVQARLRKLSLRKGAHQIDHVAHATAWYVLRGAIRLKLDADALRAAPGDVVYLGGEGDVELSAEAAVELVVVEALAAPNGDAHLVLRAAAKTPPLPYAEGKLAVRLYLDGVPAPFALDQLCAKQGAVVPRHEHSSDELLYIASGRGEVTLGDKVEVQKAGDALTIPHGTSHALRVVEDLCAVQAYTPSGPEQRFKQQPKP
jgi:quercetin dioxygenase-like cupin family protein